MKSNTKSLMTILVGITIVIATVAGTVIVSKKYLTSRDTAKEVISECEKSKNTYEFVISDNTIRPSELTVERCDEITIINKDDKNRLLAFGEHENHDDYQNLSELPIGKDKTVKFTAASPGKFIIHDHYQEVISATFIVR